MVESSLTKEDDKKLRKSKQAAKGKWSNFGILQKNPTSVILFEREEIDGVPFYHMVYKGRKRQL